jgi:CheY-like chemotaxis protein
MSSSSGGAIQRRLKGLLIDNESVFAKDASELLEDRFAAFGVDIGIVAADSADHARSLLAGQQERAPFDLVLTDMMFPPAGSPDAPQDQHVALGKDLIQLARAAGVPVVVGFTQVRPPRFQELRAEARRFKADDFYQRDDLTVAEQDSEIRSIVELLRAKLGLRTEEETNVEAAVDRRRVAVVYGANDDVRVAMFSFLRAIDLAPVEFETAIEWTGEGSPTLPDILDRLFDRTQAVVVLLSPDEQVRLHESIALRRGGVDEVGYQARPNVYFEAGMAFSHKPSRTILVELGKVRPASDLARHSVRLDDSPEQREALVNRLENAGCAVKRGKDMYSAGQFVAAVAPMAAS